MTRSGSKEAMLYELGVVPLVAEALDPDQVAVAVGRTRPDVIVHQLGAVDMRHFDRDTPHRDLAASASYPADT